jgi:hypothetical protein
VTGSLDDLSFGVWPPAIDISTPANPQSFNPQFSVANTSTTETVSLKRALLLVPVTTKGTNLALNTDMAPNNITSGWTSSHATTPPGDEGYAAFELLPDDSQGAIPPGGSVAFILSCRITGCIGRRGIQPRRRPKSVPGSHASVRRYSRR